MNLARKIVTCLVACTLGVVIGCGGNSVEESRHTDDHLGSSTSSSLTLARGAVEVGWIELSQLDEFQSQVEGLGPREQEALYAELEQLHDQLHRDSSYGGATIQPQSEKSEGGGCSSSHCSHSQGIVPAWCCSFGENGMYYQ